MDITLLNKLLKRVGKATDKEVAEEFGVSTSTVRRERVKHGIKAHGHTSVKVPIKKLGTCSDSVIAEEYGVSKQYIHQLRKKHGIPSWSSQEGVMDTTEIWNALRKAGYSAEYINTFIGYDKLPYPEDCAMLLEATDRLYAAAVAAKHLLAKLGIEPEHKIALHDRTPDDLAGAVWEGSKIVDAPTLPRTGSHCRAMRAPRIQ